MFKNPAPLLLAATLIALTTVAHATEGQEAYRDELIKILPRSEAWETWLEETGELPPDFAALPSIRNIPDPLTQGPAGTITTAAEWNAQRETLKQLFHKWVIGSVPPAPTHSEVYITHELRNDLIHSYDLEIRFGPNLEAHVRAKVMIPPGPGPFPIFLTQDNHRAWATIAFRRGYITCVYAGADSNDDTDTFLDAYPGYDWSKLTRRAWAASRCLDHLLMLRQANDKQIAITGHSRNGKQSLIAAALDERITCVIASSAGAGGPLSARYYSEHYFGEGIESITRTFPDWFSPRFRFFVGREDKLPVDLHQLVALAAPRACLLSIALNDNVESSWAMEHTYRAVKPVYDLFDAGDNIRILYRQGGHETWPTIIERYIDWCDLQFGRGDYEFPERFIHPYDWKAWNEVTPTLNFDTSHDLADRVSKMVGTSPKANAKTGTYGIHKKNEAVMLRRSEAASGLELDRITFGEYINGDIYSREGYKDSGERHPAVLWLPGACPSKGYTPAYRRGEYPHNTFARAGYVTFAYDPIGTGRRIEEVEGFYTRYPDWSLLGKMLRDAQDALKAMSEIDYIDPDRIYVVGYHVGAFLAAHLAAIDDRPAGYALVSPPPAFTTSDYAINLWSHEHMLAPQLGRFLNNPSALPYDIPDLLNAIAPNPLLLVTPKLDWHCPPEDADHLHQSALTTYQSLNAQENLSRQSPKTYNHFDASVQRHVVRWLNQQD